MDVSSKRQSAGEQIVVAKALVKLKSLHLTFGSHAGVDAVVQAAVSKGWP